MKFFSLLFFTLGFLCHHSLSAQAPSPDYTVQDLKENGLLIWLPDSKRKIELLQQNGQHNQAEKEAARMRKKNEALVQYFRNGFKFCKVDFFYSSQENDLKNGLPVLLNDELKPDAAIPVPAKRIIGGFYIKESAEHHPFPYRHFKIENSSIQMNLQAEKWLPFRLKKPSYKKDIIRLDKKLHRMHTKS